MSLSIFATPEAWISLVTLFFLEIVLGVDNLVFITITTDRLPQHLQSIGRRVGLIGALISRIIFLSFAAFMVHLIDPLFTIHIASYSHGFSIRDIILFLGGMYLFYKGIDELRDMISNPSDEGDASEDNQQAPSKRRIGIVRAVVLIMVMDIIFSIDSVITAVGMVDYLIVMILAVVLAIVLMIVFIDVIANTINKYPEMKIIALLFIVVIGLLLVADAIGLHTSMQVLGIALEKFVAYIAMVFSVVMEIIQIRYRTSRTKIKSN
ncbi:MAG: TerC family protein [Eggerthellaceae bacterium]|nr:TerC family protein [Eggerthellaceae bacterium]